MPLSLKEPRTAKSQNLTVRGTYMGVSIDKSTGTPDRALAERFLARVEREIELGNGCPPEYRPRKSGRVVSFIYAMQSGRFFKVGISDDPNGRIETTRLHNPHGVSLPIVRAVAAPIARQVEIRAHAFLSDHAVGREWFDAPLSVVEEAIAFALTGETRAESGTAPGTLVHGAFAWRLA